MISPLVSVIIPVKNAVSTLAVCLEALQRQTYPNIEVIVVDNGSTDATISLAEQFGITIAASAGRTPAARNVGVSLSHGAYLLHLDADMELNPNSIAECIAQMTQGADIIILPERNVSRGYWMYAYSFNKELVDGVPGFEYGRFMSRTLFNLVEGYDENLWFGEDRDLFLRILQAGGKVGRINSITKHHVEHLTIWDIFRKTTNYTRTRGVFERKHGAHAVSCKVSLPILVLRRRHVLLRSPLRACGWIFLLVLFVVRDIVVLYADRTFDAATTRLHTTEVNPFSAEQQFLLDTARREVTPAVAERIRAVLAESLDWPYLLNMAEHHRLIPLLSRSLRDTCPELLPPEVLGAINARAEEITRRTLVLTMELLRLLAELEQSGISALPLKGPALALQAYGDLALRSFGDLDILIHQRDLAVASAALCRLGYVTEHVLDTPRKLADYPRHCHDYKLYRHDLKLLVELQWRVIQFPFMFPVDVDGWWSQLGTMRIGGKEVRCMDHASLLLVLCVHGSKHLWERLSWICDIAELVRSSPDLDWAQLLGQAQLHGAERMLLLGLALANRLLELPIPALIQGRIAADASHIEPLIAEVLQVLFPNREQEDDLVLRRPLFYLRMRERLRDQVWVCLRHSRSLLDPLRVLRTYGPQPIKRLLRKGYAL